jgi:hypothetical protein
MKAVNELKPTKYNYILIGIKKDGSFFNYGHGSIKLENAQKNSNYWNKNFNFLAYPEIQCFEVAIINKSF